jgi:hypothetical protein
MVKVNEQLREGGMSELTGEGGGLSKLSAAELAQAYVESVQAAEVTEHVGQGGSLFYVLTDADLRAHDFTRCELEGQFT